MLQRTQLPTALQRKIYWAASPPVVPPVAPPVPPVEPLPPAPPAPPVEPLPPAPPVTIGNKMIDALIYSVTYNGSYLAVEEIITIIVISIPPVKKALDYVKQMANSR